MSIKKYFLLKKKMKKGSLVTQEKKGGRFIGNIPFSQEVEG